MAVIHVKKIPKKKVPPEDFIALFCVNFPAYTFSKARKMPYARMRQMLKIANKEHARKMLDMLDIVSAPHSKKASVKSLFEKFNAIINE